MTKDSIKSRFHCTSNSYFQECSALSVPPQLPDIISHSVILAICITLLILVHDENVFKQKPWLSYLFSCIIAISLEVNYKYNKVDMYRISLTVNSQFYRVVGQHQTHDNIEISIKSRFYILFHKNGFWSYLTTFRKNKNKFPKNCKNVLEMFC